MRHANLLTFTLLLVVAALPAPANAQAPAQAPSDAASARADDLTHRGNDLALRHQWAQAEALFRQAWTLKQSYDIGGNLGIATFALGKYRDAAEYLSFALGHFPANGKPEHRELLREKLAKAREEVASLTLKVTPDNAEVLIDGKSVGTAPIAGTVFVEPGARKVEAKLAGYETATTAVDAAKGGASEVVLAMKKDVVVRVPPPPLPVREGWRPGVPVLVTGGALAVVGLAVGTGLTVAANGKASTTATLGGQVGGPAACVVPSSACTALLNAAASRDRLSDGALWSFVGGGAFGVTTLGLAVWTLAGPKVVLPVQVVPVVGAGRSGVELRATW